MVTTSVQFTAFYDALDQAIKNSWEQTESNSFLYALAQNLQELTDRLILLGDEQAIILQQTMPKELLESKDALIFHYQWMDAAKSFLVLWRNILFENQKAVTHFLDKKLSATGQLQLKADSQANLIAAAENLKNVAQQIEHDINIQSKRALHQLENWHRQDSPWPIYRNQILTIKEQTERLKKQFLLLKGTHSTIQKIQTLILESVHHCQSEINNHKEIGTKSILYIDEQLNTQTNKIAVFLENQKANIPPEEYNQQFKSLLKKSIAQLGDQTLIAIAPHHSNIQTKNIDFKSDISEWLDSEILPLLMETWELAINMRNNLKMALINIRNRAILLQSDNKNGQDSSFDKNEFCQPLHTLLLQSTDIEKELKELHLLIQQRIDDHFQLSSVFNHDNSFLKLLNQSTLTQLRSNQSELVKIAVAWWKRQEKRAHHWLSSVQEEDALSTSEKIVRYLQSRVSKARNQSYNGIFLTKGYIGESFWVGRDQELKRIGTLIRQWEKGYRGTVLLTANRFAGKSLFGDLVSNRYFAQSTVRLLPNSVIHLDGRSFPTTYNLGEALAFVSKHNVHSKVLVWLDDLELWHDTSQPLSQNIEQLLHHIDHNFGHIFYLISLSGHLKKILDKSHQFKRSFQAEIKLDTMSLESIHEAILIRHGATHKKLVDKNGEEVLPADFKQMTARTHRASHSNIGEALSLWSCSIQPNKNDQVVYQSAPDYTLPNFLEADSALLLRSLFLEKRSTEYRLRKRFGPAFKVKYADALLRLQSIGLINRQLDDWLEINELAANDILKLLIDNDYL